MYGKLVFCTLAGVSFAMLGMLVFGLAYTLNHLYGSYFNELLMVGGLGLIWQIK